MSVLIKGMEMPTEKMKNGVAIILYPDGSVYSDIDFQWHQAVSVPTLHGRLIDADAYGEILRGLGNRDYRRERGTICDAIKFLRPHYSPTIIEAEE